MIKANTMECAGRKVANFTITNGKKELSLTVDNGALGESDMLHRADIRCFNNGEDVTMSSSSGSGSRAATISFTVDSVNASFKTKCAIAVRRSISVFGFFAGFIWGVQAVKELAQIHHIERLQACKHAEI